MNHLTIVYNCHTHIHQAHSGEEIRGSLVGVNVQCNPDVGSHVQPSRKEVKEETVNTGFVFPDCILASK